VASKIKRQKKIFMNKIKLALLLTMVSICGFSQDKVTISGYMRDGKNGEALIGATVSVKELQGIGSSTNVYGFYSLSVPKGDYTLIYSYIGYVANSKTVKLSVNTKIDVELEEEASELQEVIISTQRDDANVKSMEMGVAKIDMKTMQKMPALLGEVDVIRSIQLLPGVSTVGEGSSGFNVRGGGVDQNLILLDEAPVYNSSHLFGFFSVFNPDAVKDVKLVKGGIPAQFGGRLSSLLDVRMKDGNKKRISGTGGLGVIFSRFALEGPIVKDKGSWIVAMRRSYIDVLAKPFLKDDFKNAKFYFYDFTAKANYTINERNNIYLSGYLGRDVFSQGFGFNWGNATTTFRWNHLFSEKLFSNLTAFYSNYDYQIGIKAGNEGFDWKSRIINYSLKPEFTYYLNSKNTITFGGQSLLYDFKPGLIEVLTKDDTVRNELPPKYALENALYIGNEQEITKRISIQYGLRYSYYSYIGPGEKYTYADTTEGIRKRQTSAEKFPNFKPMQNYGNFEPRFSIKYELTEQSSIKASYNRMAQYIHLMSNTAASTPLDIWTPSTNNINPQKADQVALGYFRNFGADNKFEFSVEGYYKKMSNQIEYITGAQLLLNKNYEADLLNALGRAYGLEFFLKKSKGRFNGWMSYTLARTERITKGINNGEWFPARFDKPHTLNLVALFDITSNWTLGSNFTFSSGAPATFSTNRIELQGYVIPHNPQNPRNNYRIPNYHRLDISATYQKPKNPDKRYNWNLVFAVYNVYNRRNPFTIYFRSNADNPTVSEAVRFSVIGSFVPSVTYNFNF
jgi:hypothetical protein